MKITVSASGATADVKSGRLRLTVWRHGGVTRVVPDSSLCGCVGTHYTRVPAGTWEEMAAAAVASWKTDRGSWSPCE